MEQPYREERFLLEPEGYQLPAALTLPEGQQVRWGITLIPGSMGNDVDGNYPEMHMHPHMYADLAQQLDALPNYSSPAFQAAPQTPGAAPPRLRQAQYPPPPPMSGSAAAQRSRSQ
jgi:hypothetical protein